MDSKRSQGNQASKNSKNTKNSKNSKNSTNSSKQIGRVANTKVTGNDLSAYIARRDAALMTEGCEKCCICHKIYKNSYMVSPCMALTNVSCVNAIQQLVCKKCYEIHL